MNTNTTKIKDIKAGNQITNLTAQIIKKSQEYNTGNKKVQNIELEDETGKIWLSIWGDEINKHDIGDIITINKAYAKTYKNKTELTTGHDGTITKQ